jgi:uncharacterized 2Fe-2S/4Fe-4S cluster protein (DUF4445 family)
MIALIASSSRDVGGMAICGRSKVVTVPVFRENFGEEVRAGIMLLEEIFDSERVRVEGRKVLPGQGEPVVIEAGEMFVVGVIRKDKVVLVEMEQESSSDERPVERGVGGQSGKGISTGDAKASVVYGEAGRNEISDSNAR